MPLENRKCPSCGSPIQIDTSRESVFCSYCGTKFAPSGRANGNNKNPSVAKWHEAAEKLFALGKYGEAREYWYKASQVDPTDGDVRVGLCRVWLKYEILAPHYLEFQHGIEDKLKELSKLDYTHYLMALDYASPEVINELNREIEETRAQLNSLLLKSKRKNKESSRTLPAFILGVITWFAVMFACSFILSGVVAAGFNSLPLMFALGIGVIIICCIAAGKVYKKFKYRD